MKPCLDKTSKTKTSIEKKAIRAKRDAAKRREMLDLKSHFKNRRKRSYRDHITKEYENKVDACWILGTLEVIEDELAKGINDSERLKEVGMLKDIQLRKLNKVMPDVRAIEVTQDRRPMIVFNDPMLNTNNNNDISTGNILDAVVVKERKQ